MYTLAEMISWIVKLYLFKIKRTWINYVGIGMGVKIAIWGFIFILRINQTLV